MPWLCGNATSLGVPNKNSLHVAFSWEEGEGRGKWGRERRGDQKIVCTEHNTCI